MAIWRRPPGAARLRACTQPDDARDWGGAPLKRVFMTRACPPSFFFFLFSLRCCVMGRNEEDVGK